MDFLLPTIRESFTVLYHVEFIGKRKVFRMQSAIRGWCIKQIMLKVFEAVYKEQGDYSVPTSEGEAEQNVFAYWHEVKRQAVPIVNQFGYDCLEAWIYWYLEYEAM